MEAREAFKMGFLLRCAEERLDPAQVRERVKRAGQFGDAVGGALSLGTGVFTKLLPALAVGGGALTGLTGGHALAKLQDPGYDPEEINRQELLATYDTLADELEERQRMRQQAGQL